MTCHKKRKVHHVVRYISGYYVLACPNIARWLSQVHVLLSFIPRCHATLCCPMPTRTNSSEPLISLGLIYIYRTQCPFHPTGWGRLDYFFRSNMERSHFSSPWQQVSHYTFTSSQSASCIWQGVPHCMCYFCMSRIGICAGHVGSFAALSHTDYSYL